MTYISAILSSINLKFGIKCADGTYGYDCVNNCSGHCSNDSLCNEQTGHCDRGCGSGNDCSKGTHDLSYNKIATQSHTFLGWNTYYASSAIDRNASSCTRTKTISRISIHKTVCWKDGPELPPLNFTTNCVEQGRYIIFYNERLEEVIYPQEYESFVITELCEVIVKGCDTLMFGNNCAPCPTNCEDNKCQHGKCFACKPGWVGMFCNKKCIEGWYGDNCNQQCQEHCRDNATCNHVTGLCDKSSAAGWTGNICDKGTFEIS
uniref:Scavenger receptor class F member 2 n=1 Tax=Magallana gigas TaxID=29159 RepID=K1QD44_MAGGI